MAGFSYVQAIGSGFRVIGRKPWVILAWAVTYLVLAVLPLTLIMAQVLPDVLATYRDAAHAMTRGVAPDPTRALALRSEFMVLRPVILLIELVAYTVLIGAAFRAILEPQASRWGYLRLGRRELWLGSSLAIFLLVFAVLVFTLLEVLHVAAAVGVASAHYGHSPGPLAYPLLKLIQLVCGLAILWVMLRLSLALPMSFAEKRFVFYEAWGLSRRQGLKLFLVGLTLFAVLFACDIAATQALKALQLDRLANPAAWRAGLGVLGAVLGMALFAILAAPFADIYRQLSGEKAA
jgi:hypothetical protein